MLLMVILMTSPVKLLPFLSHKSSQKMMHLEKAKKTNEQVHKIVALIMLGNFKMFSLRFSNKMLAFRAGIHKTLRQNSKQGIPRSDCFFRSSLIWVSSVCRDLLGRQIVFEILEHKFLNLFPFCYQINCWFSGLEFTKCLSE